MIDMDHVLPFQTLLWGQNRSDDLLRFPFYSKMLSRWWPGLSNPKEKYNNNRILVSRGSLSLIDRNMIELWPPRQGGNPSPNTAPMSPSKGLFKMPSCKHSTASLTNRDTSRYCKSESDELKGQANIFRLNPTRKHCGNQITHLLLLKLSSDDLHSRIWSQFVFLQDSFNIWVDMFDFEPWLVDIVALSRFTAFRKELAQTYVNELYSALHGYILSSIL